MSAEDLSRFERETLVRIAFARRPYTAGTTRSELRRGGYYGLIQRRLLELETKGAPRSVLRVTAAGFAALRAQPCTECGVARSATCVGQYDAMREPALACDACCGHGCEDGRCVRLTEDE